MILPTSRTDYNGSYGYQNTDAAIRNGGDLMLGYGTADSNKEGIVVETAD